MGKSTVALRVAAEAKRRGRTVWWVNAGDPASLQGGLLEILRQAEAPADVLRQLRDGRPTASAVFWQFLASRGKTRALLIFDNADTPSVLSSDGHSAPGDGDGWIRPDASIPTIVTTRATNPRVWGDWVALRRLGALPDDRAADLLRRLAPDVSDPSGIGALSLARRLGGMPLALRLAGTYLASPFSRWGTFDSYRTALDTTETALAELDLESAGLITSTWELSLDSLAARGIDQTRPFLYLLACFDPLNPAITQVLTSRDAGEILRGLAEVALIDVVSTPGSPAVTLHPVVADACRVRLRGGNHYELIREAVGYLVAAADALDPERAADWLAWERLLPHIAAVASWAAPQLNEPSLVALLELGRKASVALWTKSSAALWGSGGHRNASDDLIRSLEAAASLLGEEHPSRIMARYQSAVVLLRSGAHAQAGAALETVLDDALRVLGPRHRDTLVIRDGLCGLYLVQERFAEAEGAYRSLIADQEIVFGREDPTTLATRIDLAWSMGMQGRYAEAAEICAAVVDIDCRILGPEHHRTLDARSDLARWLLGAGQVGEAHAHAADLLADTDRVLGPHHPMSLLTRAVLAKAQAANGHDTEATFAKILTTMDRDLGPHDYRTVLVRHDRAEARAVLAARRG